MPSSKLDPVVDAEEGWKDRRDEIEIYFDFVKMIIDGRATLNVDAPPTPGGRKEEQISGELKRILMAMGNLALYNLIESTIRNFVLALYKEFKGRDIQFEQTLPCVQRVILKDFKNHASADKVMSDLKDLRTRIIEASLCEDKLFSGNVDARELDNVADRYGFKLPAMRGRIREHLKDVKEKRNDLAHGLKSFLECVEFESVDELMKMKSDIIAYMERLTESIGAHIRSQGYLQRPDSSGS